MGYNRRDLAVKVNLTKNTKGYTMKDIGALEDRISKIEYYTVLNALALDTKTLSIRDSTGQIERFKDGIFADPLNDDSIARSNDIEFNLAVDSSKSLARPNFDELYHKFDLQSATSSNIKVAGRLLMLDYDNEQVVCNPYATTYRNCTESFYSFKGNLILFPDYDSGSDTTNLAPQTVEIDLAGAFQDLQALGAFKDISKIQGNPEKIGETSTTRDAGGNLRQTTTTSTYASKVTTTIKDIEVGSSANKQNLGEFVKDVSALPYLRARTVAVWATGLRPNCRVYPWFDTKSVSAYCRPATVKANYATNGFLDSSKVTDISSGNEANIFDFNGALADPLVTDNNGNIAILFYIPANTFRSGERTFLLTNVDDLAATSAIITSAESVYVGNSLSVTKQQLSFNVIEPKFTSTSVSTTSTVITTDTQTTYRQVSPPPERNNGGDRKEDPVGQTFNIPNTSDAGIGGIYLSQLGVYFKKKHGVLGVTCRICETTAGVPDVSKELGSTFLLSSQVSVSEDSSSETIFTFKEPVLLQSDKTYFFWFVPEANNPDYEIWLSEVGNKDKLTGVSITKQPFAGIVYASSDGTSWTPYQSQDLKFNMYRAKFNQTSGTAVFRNAQEEFLSLTNLYRINSGVPIQPGDLVYTANTDNLSEFLTDSSKFPKATVKTADEVTGVFYLEDSNGLFNTTTRKNLRFFRPPNTSITNITTTYLIANAEISTIDNPLYHGFVPKFTFFEPAGTEITQQFYGTANSTYSYAKDGTPVQTVNERLVDYTDYERVIRSYSSEVAAGSYGSNGTATFAVTLTSSSQYLSPVIDLGTRTFNFIRNKINNDETNEHTRYGSAQARYISKIVALNAESEDIRVYVTGYRPVGTDISVYGKFLNDTTDSEPFDNKQWTKLSFDSSKGISLGTTYSSPSKNEANKDYREYIYVLPTSNAYPQTAFANNNTNIAYDPIGTITYNDSLGNQHLRYTKFALKVVLTSNNPVNIPTMRDIRAVALQM